MLEHEDGLVGLDARALSLLLLSEGDVDGLLLGLLLGDALGLALGLELGLVEGLALGLVDGLRDGLPDGETDGLHRPVIPGFVSPLVMEHGSSPRPDAHR